MQFKDMTDNELLYGANTSDKPKTPIIYKYAINQRMATLEDIFTEYYIKNKLQFTKAYYLFTDTDQLTFTGDTEKNGVGYALKGKDYCPTKTDIENNNISFYYINADYYDILTSVQSASDGYKYQTYYPLLLYTRSGAGSKAFTYVYRKSNGNGSTFEGGNNFLQYVSNNSIYPEACYFMSNEQYRLHILKLVDLLYYKYSKNTEVSFNVTIWQLLTLIHRKNEDATFATLSLLLPAEWYNEEAYLYVKEIIDYIIEHFHDVRGNIENNIKYPLFYSVLTNGKGTLQSALNYRMYRGDENYTTKDNVYPTVSYGLDEIGPYVLVLDKKVYICRYVYSRNNKTTKKIIDFDDIVYIFNLLRLDIIKRLIFNKIDFEPLRINNTDMGEGTYVSTQLNSDNMSLYGEESDATYKSGSNLLIRMADIGENILNVNAYDSVIHKLLSFSYFYKYLNLEDTANKKLYTDIRNVIKDKGIYNLGTDSSVFFTPRYQVEKMPFFAFTTNFNDSNLCLTEEGLNKIFEVVYNDENKMTSYMTDLAKISNNTSEVQISTAKFVNLALNESIEITTEIYPRQYLVFPIILAFNSNYVESPVYEQTTLFDQDPKANFSLIERQLNYHINSFELENSKDIIHYNVAFSDSASNYIEELFDSSANLFPTVEKDNVEYDNSYKEQIEKDKATYSAYQLENGIQGVVISSVPASTKSLTFKLDYTYGEQQYYLTYIEKLVKNGGTTEVTASDSGGTEETENITASDSIEVTQNTTFTSVGSITYSIVLDEKETKLNGHFTQIIINSADGNKTYAKFNGTKLSEPLVISVDVDDGIITDINSTFSPILDTIYPPNAENYTVTESEPGVGANVRLYFCALGEENLANDTITINDKSDAYLETIAQAEVLNAIVPKVIRKTVSSSDVYVYNSNYTTTPEYEADSSTGNVIMLGLSGLLLKDSQNYRTTTSPINYTIYDRMKANLHISWVYNLTNGIKVNVNCLNKK